MQTKTGKTFWLLALTFLSPQAAHAHSGLDAIPLLVAMPMGQVISIAIIIWIFIKFKHRIGVIIAASCSSLITSILIWIFGFPFLGFILFLAPTSLWAIIPIFGIYGFFTSFLGGLSGGLVFRRAFEQHRQSFGSPLE